MDGAPMATCLALRDFVIIQIVVIPKFTDVCSTRRFLDEVSGALRPVAHSDHRRNIPSAVHRTPSDVVLPMGEITGLVTALSDIAPEERACVSIAIDIAVSCQQQHKAVRHRPTDLGKICGSAPHRLSSLDKRASRVQRRSGSTTSCLKKGKHTSLLDLSDLDFSQAEESDSRVDLHEKGVTPGGLGHITRALASVRLSDAVPLTELNLAFNKLGNDGAASLAWAAMQGALVRLRRLVLTGNQLTRLSGLATAARAGELPALEVLYLSSNLLGARAISELLSATDDATGKPALRGLKQLFVDHNAVGVDTASNLAPTPEQEPAASDDGGSSVDAIRAIARACPSAALIDVSSNSLRDEHLDELANAIETGVVFGTRSSAASARLHVSLNVCTRAAIERLEAVCAARGGVRLVS